MNLTPATVLCVFVEVLVSWAPLCYHVPLSEHFRAPEPVVAEVSLTGPNKGEAATACGQVRSNARHKFKRAARTY